MSLRSSLLAGDQKLEAAAVLDSAHIVQGAKGDHVQKLQLALVISDDVPLGTDGIYGPKTAAAVRAFKKRRSIINTTYQATVDDIVGKMTMRSLDNEVLAWEQTPRQKPRVEVVLPQTPAVRRNPRPVDLGLSGVRHSLNAKTAPGLAFDDFSNLLAPSVSTTFMELAVGTIGVFRVFNAKGALLSNSDSRLAYVFDPNLQNAHGNNIAIYKDMLELNVKALHPGSCSISINFPAAANKGLWSTTGLRLRIRFISDQADFTPGVAHNHQPCGDWNRVKNDPNSSVVSSDVEAGDGLVTLIGAPVIGVMVRNSNSPRDVVDKVRMYPFGPKARTHMDWYLTGGGKEFVEDDNIRDWLYQDEGIRKKLTSEIKAASSNFNNLVRGHFRFEQVEYQNDDFVNAWGALDRVDYEADLAGGQLTVWFKDRYEWHPYYPGIYTSFPDDEARVSNGLHAAFVEMKQQGAADFWMQGEYTVAMI